MKPVRAMRPEIIDLIRVNFLDDPVKVRRIRKIPIMQEQFFIKYLIITIKMIDPARIKAARPADDTMNNIPLLQQQLRQIRSILSRNPGYQSYLCHNLIIFLFLHIL